MIVICVECFCKASKLIFPYLMVGWELAPRFTGVAKTSTGPFPLSFWISQRQRKQKRWIEVRKILIIYPIPWKFVPDTVEVGSLQLHSLFRDSTFSNQLADIKTWVEWNWDYSWRFKNMFHLVTKAWGGGHLTAEKTPVEKAKLQMPFTSRCYALRPV